jgi:hypothetical protein
MKGVAMNTLQELLDNNINTHNANRMLETYNNKINTTNGIYTITDITYNLTSKDKIVTLKCNNCGCIIHRHMVSGRNKWSELIKTCPCQKQEKIVNQEAEFEKILKIKKDLILGRVGKQYGDFKIVSVDDIDSAEPKYIMQCVECGFEKRKSAVHFYENASHACTKHYVQPIKYDDSYIGRKNNFLTIIGYGKDNQGKKAFECKCDCGSTVMVKPTFWEDGRIKSCGCKQKELLSEINTKHGHSGDRLYRVWRSMIDRCERCQNISYKNYGGRGITVCGEWRNSFEAFYEWAVSTGYDYNADFGECTIDRIDVNGNYEPSNCRWVDVQTQANNRRPKSEWNGQAKTYTINGITKTIKQWYEEYHTSQPTVAYRMKTLGMTFEQALATPKVTMGRPRKEVV